MSSVVPIPGGLGAAGTIVLAGLSSVGVAHGVAAAVSLSYRVMTYWFPPLPGMAMLYDLSRRRLV